MRGPTVSKQTTSDSIIEGRGYVVLSHKSHHEQLAQVQVYVHNVLGEAESKPYVRHWLSFRLGLGLDSRLDSGLGLGLLSHIILRGVACFGQKANRALACKPTLQGIVPRTKSAGRVAKYS